MLIDLNSFERERRIDETLPAGSLDLDLPNARIVSDVSLEGEFLKSAASTTLKGKVSGTLEIDCDRCLEPQQRPIDVELDLEFVPPSSFAAEANLELQGDALKLDAIPDDSIDTVDIAREQILLDIPQQFFCKEDCQGLCQKCGTNLNEADCGCSDTEIDPRWAALKNLN
jgi:uncharacterized protein